MSTPVVAFVSLFLGLVVGPHQVEVEVSVPVVRLELRLDGETAGVLQTSPFRFPCDFGVSPVPHLLEAVAFDEEGKEVGRAEQWINLPSQPVEASLVIERPEGDRAYARLSWAHRLDLPLIEALVSFDGRELEVEDPSRIPLPKHEMSSLHYLRAELAFADGLSTVEEAIFGGSYSDEVSAELTALPVILAQGVAAPDPDAMQGWFESERPLRVAAIDKGPAEIVFIRDQVTQPQLVALGGKKHAPSANVGYSHDASANRFAFSLKKDQRLGFFWPFIQQGSGAVAVFPATQGWYSARDGGLGWFLANVRPPEIPAAEQLLADAVAVAGMNALSRSRRRAVVLILGEEPVDRSAFSPEQVRDYLRSIRVPLFVWSPTGGREGSGWGPVVDISSRGRFRKAVDQLSEAVDRQRIVWFEGRHLPQQIALTDSALDVTFPE